MKEVQLQSFYSVSQCAGWCLHKSLWLNYSGESTHILYDNPWRIVQPQIPQPAANLLRGSDCGQVGPDDWERQRDKSFQLYASCDYSLSLLIDIELTYPPYILYHLTGTLGGTSLHRHSVFFLLSCQSVKTHNAYHLVTVLYVFMKHECCTCNCRGSPDKIITKQWLFKTFCHCLFEVVWAQAVIPTANCPPFSWNTVKGLKWIYSNYYSHMFHRGWKFPHLRRVSAADCRCCCADEHWTRAPWEKPCSRHTNSKVRTLHNTQMLLYSRILFPPPMHRSHFRQTVWKVGLQKFPSHFTAEKFRSCSSHAGMWNVSSGKTWARQTQRPFWQRRKP